MSGVRVIAGRWRGCRLEAPPGVLARPTTDRVKESMFNLMGFSWQGGTAVDLFAGSGALGLEALSRGAHRAVFVDTHPQSLAAVHSNLARCMHAESAAPADLRQVADYDVWRLDWEIAWHRLEQSGEAVGWVFVDPPYRLQLWPRVLHVIGASTLPVRYGVVCEHPDTDALPERVGRLQLAKSKRYGNISVTLFAQRGDV